MKHYLSNLLIINLILGVSLNLFSGEILAQNYIMARCNQITKDCGRGGNKNKINIIISPNTTTLLNNNRDKISWRKVEGTIKYIVRIKTSKGEISKFETTNNEIKYTDYASILKPGLRYKLIVEAVKSEISVVKIETEFIVFNPDILNKKIELIKSGKQLDILYRELGEIYEDIGEIDLAKTHYLKAIIAAQKTDNLKAQALAEVRLMVITKDDDERKKHQQNAQSIYEKLGDKKLLEEFKKLINK